MTSRPHLFLGFDYLDALRAHYPEVERNQQNAFGFVGNWNKVRDRLAQDGPDRFMSPEKHGFSSDLDVWKVSAKGDVRWVGASTTYKGLIIGKTPFDLLLYTNLIWELQPKTIIEFGALQGGSGLWFTDQLQVLTGGGEVHSFELLIKCIHPRASHPSLHFHEADLRDVSQLDRGFLEGLAHPWLVVDDAHVNLEALVPFMSGLMKPGDYYVIEDEYMSASNKVRRAAAAMMHECGLEVDTKFTNAFGRNVTQSPNSWLRKR
jgi:cephalosporin hydroxylase